MDVDTDGDTAIVRARHSAIFTNWILFRRQLVRLGLLERKNVIVDLSQTLLVDHSVMEKLHELSADFAKSGVSLEITGLDGHRQLSDHELAARKRAMAHLKRITIVTEDHLEEMLEKHLLDLGASGYTSMPCRGAGRNSLPGNATHATPQVRIEAVVPQVVAEQILDYLRTEVTPNHRVTACTETIDVLCEGDF
jgi:MFS superfamily sulfate permease-like transporter